ncbi:MAG: hypothetical protein ACR2KV_01885, partial [Solirubrobacteraceae bacterium]
VVAAAPPPPAAPEPLRPAVERPAAVVEAPRIAAPKRPRSATVHRPSAPPAGAMLPVVSGPGQSLRAVLPQALSAVGEESGWDAVTMWHRVQSRRPLTCLGIWTRPGTELDWFESISWRAKLDLGEPPAGDLDPDGRLTWLSDLGSDGGSVRERTARSADLTTRVVAPLCGGEDIVGAIEVFARTARHADDAAVARLTTAAGLLAPLLLREMQDAEQRRWRI